MRRPGLLALLLWLSWWDRRGRRVLGDRGDVPGWVMVTIMTAAIVVVLIPFVGPIIARAFSHAVSTVTQTPSGSQ